MDDNELKDDSSDENELKPEEKQIADWLKKIKFKRQWVGGVNEQDVWKKIAELHAMYEEALKAERIRYDTLIDHYKSLTSGRRGDQDGEVEYE